MSHFFAYLFRMKLITRWPLMHNVRSENVQEHSLQVAMIAHGLAVIENRLYEGDFDVYKIATLAMFHDASEVFTGDMPTPIKYFNERMSSAYKDIEAAASQKLLAMIPQELHSDYIGMIDTSEICTEEKILIKAADTLAAYLKCIEEMRFGNHEFEAAYKRIELILQSHSLQSVHYFMTHYMPSFHQSFDQMTDSSSD